jgi:hypothetical protein
VCRGLLRHEVQQKHEPTPFNLYTTVHLEQQPVTAEQRVREPIGV